MTQGRTSSPESRIEILWIRVQAAQHLNFSLVRPSAENLVKPTKTSDLQNAEILNGCCAKPLSPFGNLLSSNRNLRQILITRATKRF